MWGKSAPCRCRPSPPAELPEPFSHWFVPFVLGSLHKAMWYEVIRVPGVTERESGSEPAEHKCEAGLKSRLCSVTIWEMLVLTLNWHKFHDSLCSFSLLIPGELGECFPARFQSEKRIAICFQEPLKSFIFYTSCKLLLCLFAYQFIFSLLVHLLYI